MQTVSYTHLDVYKRQGEADSKTGQAAFNAATTGSADYQSWLTGTWQGGTQDLSLIHI